MWVRRKGGKRKHKKRWYTHHNDEFFFQSYRVPGISISLTLKLYCVQNVCVRVTCGTTEFKMLLKL